MNPHTHAHVQRLQVTLGDQSVGMLAMAPKGAIVFEYSTDWIAHGFDIAPKSLAFNTQPQLAKSPLFGGLHGVFNDSLPDGWGLLGATSLITRDVRQVERAFRWMAFNVLAHNKDDHAKNFAFIHTLQGWQLSPAYDLTFSHGMGQEHTTAVLGHGNPGPQEMLQLAANFQIPHAAEIIAQTVDAVAHWPELARANGVGRALTNEIQSALSIIAQRFI